MKFINISDAFSGLTENQKFSLYRKLWQKAASYEILTSFPLHLDIELSGICNLKCASCFQKLIKIPLGLMNFDLFKKVINEGVKKGLCAIKLQVRGESFLHPDLFNCIAFAKEKGVMDIQITTNATLLNEKNIEEILESGLDAIIFSVDDHHNKSFKQKNRESFYSSVELSIKNLLKRKIQLGKSRPWVRLQTSINQTGFEHFKKAEYDLQEKFPEADIFIVNRMHNFKDDTDGYPDLQTNYDFNFCSYLMHRLSIFWNGEVTTCCGDYNNRLQLGNINFQTIEEIWHSAKMNNFRKMHLNGKRNLMPICRHCIACLKSKHDDFTPIDKKQHIADYLNLNAKNCKKQSSNYHPVPV